MSNRPEITFADLEIGDTFTTLASGVEVYQKTAPNRFMSRMTGREFDLLRMYPGVVLEIVMVNYRTVNTNVFETPQLAERRRLAGWKNPDRAEWGSLQVSPEKS